MTARTNTRRTTTVISAAAAAGALLLTGCSGSSDSSAGAEGSSAFSYLSFAENTSIQDTLTALSEDACSTENEAAPLEVTTQPQATYDQQLQLQSGQGALPTLFASGNSPLLAQELDDAGQLVDVGSELESLGKTDAIIPAAQSTIEAIYGDTTYVLPTEFNVEGIWYNKALFEDNEITPPTTWTELVDAATELAAAGITPLSADGKDGWPLTRLVGNYLYRTLGPDALQKVADGDAALTDPEYVAAAEAIADLGAEGFFGKSVGSIDYDGALNQFLTGDAAMFYMGSWALANFNDPAQNKIGAENIGFLPFPDVEGGAGTSSQLAANIGVPLAMADSAFDSGAKEWLGCIADNFGTQSLADQGVITGFASDVDASDLPPLTALVQEEIDRTDETVLWFEALFNPEAATTSQTNAQLLVTGKMSPEDFMAAVQRDLG
ncbi:raffinose/stachyose/melibiose transport system substrate-binding protein [Mumia flava]|uniref:Raffinose/stachyose/melibiose transport system substrate-binding protein n=1 Tax=Mumia flava TaxID=1348852 RepID=A0A0B2B0J3_9ACTN|nr:extracellular solute-binding protein [Mumia flava]PJJ54364.1 raffinose/stachyose/melibiose transport system substrate-binding protein [Mumia flava]